MPFTPRAGLRASPTTPPSQSVAPTADGADGDKGQILEGKAEGTHLAANPVGESNPLYSRISAVYPGRKGHPAGNGSGKLS